MVRATAHGGLVRAFAINATGVVREIRERHQTFPSATAALGRLSIGALMFGAMLKEEDQIVTIRVQGDGPGGSLVATANGAGEVRSLMSNPQAEIEENRNGKLNVRGLVGTSGHLTVSKDLGLRQPYAGTVELVSGEIGEDLTYYLATSEQTPSSVGIGVLVDVDNSVVAAGGYMVQLLPGLDDEAISRIEEMISALPHPTAMIRGGDTPEQILARIFGDDVAVLGRTPVRFACPCSRERVANALALLGNEEIDAMIEEASEDRHEIKCRFCNAAYYFTNPDLAALKTA